MASARDNSDAAPSGKLAGQAGIVTGAAQGIGEATARRFAREGACVTCVDLDAGRVGEVVAAIEREGGRAVAVGADVSTAEGNRRAVMNTVASFGRLSFFFANAAIQIFGTLEEATEEDWQRLYATNLRGVALGVEHALPAMRANGGGAVIITSSVLGLVGEAHLPAYGAMKGGLRALCRSLSCAHGPDQIRVNTICPGAVDTPILQQFFDFQEDGEATRRRILERYSLGRFASPDDVASAALFLASDDAAYITGTDIVVDGGLLARVY